MSNTTPNLKEKDKKSMATEKGESVTDWESAVDSSTPTVFYRTLNVEGLEIFYREAGPQDAPTVLLLHGFPPSAHMFRNLIPMLADKYHVVAPDFPGYGESSAPSVDDFDYSFEREVLGQKRCITRRSSFSPHLSLPSDWPRKCMPSK